MDGITRVYEQNPGSPGYDEALLSICRLSQIINSEQPFDHALQCAAESSAALARADKAAILIVDESSDRPSLKSSYKLSKQSVEARDPCFGDRLVRRCIAKAMPLVFGDIRSERDELLDKEGVESAVCVPISLVGKGFGAILVMSKKRRGFTTAEIELLNVIANQTALALWRADDTAAKPVSGAGLASSQAEEQLIGFANRKIRDLSMLNQVSEAVTGTLDLEKLLEIVLNQAMLAVSATVGSLMLTDDSTQSLTIRAARGLSNEIIRETRVPVGKGIAGWVALHGLPILVHRGKDDERFRTVAFRDDITSAMSVPLKCKDHVLGVLNVNTTREDHLFNERDMELLGTLANQMSMAIYNAGLHSAVQEQNRHLAAMLEVARSTSSTLDLDDVLSVLIDQICALANVDTCLILLRNENTGHFRPGAARGPEGISERDYLDLAVSIAARSAQSRNPVQIADLAISPDIPPKNQELLLAQNLHAMLAVPLRAGDKVIGSIIACSHIAEGFGTTDVRMLTSLANLAGVAVQNARTYRRQYRMAQLLQSDLMPKAALQAPGIDVGQIYLPAREVGGDYFDFVQVGPDKIGIVIADVSGCSIPAATFISMGKHVLRAYARGNNSPADVLARVNAIVYEDTPAELFISMFYGILDLKTRVFRYAVAGQEPPLLYRSSTRRFSLLESPGILIGILPEADFTERKVTLTPGDLLAFYTDGLTEASAGNQRFGREQIKDELKRNALKPAQQIADNIHARLLTFTSEKILDDVAIVTVKIL